VVDVGILMALFMVCKHTKYCLNLSDCVSVWWLQRNWGAVRRKKTDSLGRHLWRQNLLFVYTAVISLLPSSFKGELICDA